MRVQPSRDNGVGPVQSKAARAAEWLERYLRMSSIIGIRAMLFTISLLIIYLAIGSSLTVINSPRVPSNFLSVTNPSFYLIGTGISLFVTQATASLILYQFLTGIEDVRSQLVVLMSYIGLGCGAAALRFLLFRTVELVYATVLIPSKFIHLSTIPIIETLCPYIGYKRYRVSDLIFSIGFEWSPRAGFKR